MKPEEHQISKVYLLGSVITWISWFKTNDPVHLFFSGFFFGGFILIMGIFKLFDKYRGEARE